MCAFSVLKLENVSVIISYRLVCWLALRVCRRWNHQKTLMHRVQMSWVEGCGLSWSLTVLAGGNSLTADKLRICWFWLFCGFSKKERITTMWQPIQLWVKHDTSWGSSCHSILRRSHIILWVDFISFVLFLFLWIVQCVSLASVMADHNFFKIV